jgi:hypothetical protein
MIKYSVVGTAVVANILLLGENVPEAQECNHTQGNIPTKRKLVYGILTKNPLEKPQTIALLLRDQHGIIEQKPYNYIRKLRHEFKVDLQRGNILGQGSSCRNGKSTHKVRVDGNVPISVDQNGIGCWLGSEAMLVFSDLPNIKSPRHN